MISTKIAYEFILVSLIFLGCVVAIMYSYNSHTQQAVRRNLSKEQALMYISVHYPMARRDKFCELVFLQELFSVFVWVHSLQNIDHKSLTVELCVSRPPVS